MVAVLREVKYLEIRSDEEIPESASNIYAKNDTLRQFINNLDLATQWYNFVRNSVLEVESPLIEEELQGIDTHLEQAESSLNWTNEAAWEYIQQTRDTIHDLQKRVVSTKDNVEQIQKIMATWSKQPLFERKEGKHETLLNLDDREDRLNKRYTEIREAGDKIHKLLEENRELFKADSESEIWKAYVDYVDEMIVDGFIHTVQCSLKFLLDETESKPPNSALFEAHLELHAPEMVFKPSLDSGMADGFFDLIDSIVGDIYKQASLIPRLSKHSEVEHYQVSCFYER